MQKTKQIGLKIVFYRCIGVVSLLVMLALVSFSAAQYAWAASDTDFNQTITTGTFATDIKDSARVSVANPSVAMSSVSFPFVCLTGGSRPTGNFGTHNQRIYIENAGIALDGWSLTLGPTGTSTAVWSDGGTESYDFNDPDTGGCADGAGDADSVAGQMTVDPTGITAGTELQADCITCDNTDITAGSAYSFDEAAPATEATLLTAGNTSSEYGRWYLTDSNQDGSGTGAVVISQTIPAEQSAASYSINLTLTLTSN